MKNRSCQDNHKWERVFTWALAIMLALVVALGVMAFFPAQAHVLVLVVGLILCGIGLQKILQGISAQKWVATEALLHEAREGCREVFIRYSSIFYFFPIVEYEYCFDGKTYRSNRVSFSIENVWVSEPDTFIKKIETLKFWAAWQEGDKITVYVNPAKPSESVIVRKVTGMYNSQNLALIFAGAILSLLWVYFFLFDIVAS